MVQNSGTKQANAVDLEISSKYLIHHILSENHDN